MICPICRTEPSAWKDISEFRLKKVDPKGKKIEFVMCETCGFVTYLGRYQTEAEIKAYYKKEYRPAPQAQNLFTGERKLQYHAHFLAPLFEEWKKAEIDAPVIGEIGSAHGMLLNWIKHCIPYAEIHGTELTETYRRVAFHEYGIKLQDELPKDKKYDLLVSYHVLEHQLDPDLRLQEYASMLKDNGLFYLSCPIWFRDANNNSTFDIEYYWAPDHINSWSEEHLEWIIAKAGLEVVHKDTAIYGNTYLLKKVSTNVQQPVWDINKNLKIVKDLFDTWIALQENDTARAIATYPNCISAWIHHYELNKGNFHKDLKALNKFLDDAVAACPHSADALTFKGDVLSRYDRYEEAHNAFNLALKKKPNNPTILMGVANCYRKRAMKEKDPVKRELMLRDAINIGRMIMSISTESMGQSLSWVYHDCALLPVLDWSFHRFVPR